MTRRRQPPVITALLLLSFAAASGCGSIRNHMQRIPVTSVPIGASVAVDGRPGGQTPVMIWLDRRAKEHVIRIESPGYDPVEIRSERTTNGPVLLGDFLMGLAPALLIAMARSLNDHDAHPLAYAAGFGILFSLIDLSQGTTYDVKPKEIVVTLIRTLGEPKARTIVIEAEDMRKLVWIRVRL